MNKPSGPQLDVNLGALVENYRLLAGHASKAACAAVVKADAYGLGAGRVAEALYKAGCREFFVATLEEAARLRRTLTQQDAQLYVFHGARPGEEQEFAVLRAMPVLNDMAQWERWPAAQPHALHVDTGMCRLGITPREALSLAGEGRALKLVISHLACANDPDHPKNREQADAFAQMRAHFKGVRGSLANSSGVFLGEAFHHDLLRPGCSLYGITPRGTQDNPMRHVATLSAPVLQFRSIETRQTVGYSATAEVMPGTSLAIVECGYADGIPRQLSGKLLCYAGATKLPVIGRISMDMVAVDVSALSPAQRTPELRLNFICEHQPVDQIARAAGTIGYEIFTGIGRRVRRHYTA